MISGPRHKGFVHSVTLTGHRRSYVAIFRELFELDEITGRLSYDDTWRCFSAKRILFAMLDENHFSFAFVALARALFGRRTVGLSLRLHTCVRSDRLLQKLKYLVFHCLRFVPFLTVATISDFRIDPGLRRLAHVSVPDPQLWDVLQRVERGECFLSPIAEGAKQLAAGRRIVLVCGLMGVDKGTSFLKNVLSLCGPELDDFFFVFAGRFDQRSASLVDDLTRLGALVRDAYISDEDMFALYQACDFVWACYSASYDQPSGIFGRAVQFGVPAFVRRNSAIHKFALLEGLSCIPVEFDGADDFANALRVAHSLQRYNPPLELIRSWRSDFLTKIGSAL